MVERGMGDFCLYRYIVAGGLQRRKIYSLALDLQISDTNLNSFMHHYLRFCCYKNVKSMIEFGFTKSTKWPQGRVYSDDFHIFDLPFLPREKKKIE